MSSYLSAYELAVLHGYRGTQEEWVCAVERGEHGALLGRDSDGAHPISAIDGLEARLSLLEARLSALEGGEGA